jgi:CDP-diacylglycerol---serine O-phosphatidyltransferase
VNWRLKTVNIALQTPNNYNNIKGDEFLKSSHNLPKVAVSSDDIEVILDPKSYFERLISLIHQAKYRISIIALYLEDDEAGRAVLQALVEAKEKSPSLSIKVYVDFHRAHRGLIGAAASEGNARLYREIQRKYPNAIQFFGIPVRKKEIFGVLHMKGIVIDDRLVYSGASLNNVYLHQGPKYRYDRYFLIKNQALANSFCHYIDTTFSDSAIVPRIDSVKPELDLKKELKKFQKVLRVSQYQLIDEYLGKDEVSVAPLVGFGARGNQLNSTIKALIQSASDSIVLYTPYFNLPAVLKREIRKQLKRGVKVEIVVGDKTANDFFQSNDQKFSRVGLVPYLYEILLRNFVKSNEQYIKKDLLNIRLWRHDANTYHLKGLNIDNQYHLITGNNFNPRAWKRDLENGILINDQNNLMSKVFNQEHQTIISHTQLVEDVSQIETMTNYPVEVQKWLRRFKLGQIDKILHRWM